MFTSVIAFYRCRVIVFCVSFCVSSPFCPNPSWFILQLSSYRYIYTVFVGSLWVFVAHELKSSQLPLLMQLANKDYQRGKQHEIWVDQTATRVCLGLHEYLREERAVSCEDTDRNARMDRNAGCKVCFTVLLLFLSKVLIQRILTSQTLDFLKVVT